MQYDQDIYQGEPSLQEVMSDPMVQLMINRDGQTSDEVWTTIQGVQAGLKARRAESANQP